MRIRVLLAALLGATMSCVDAPFESASPNDRAWEGTMWLQATRDTVWAANPRFAVQLVSEPVLHGFIPVWGVSSGGLVVHEGNGVFRVTRTVLDPTPVQVSARFAGAGASTIIYVVPDPEP